MQGAPMIDPIDDKTSSLPFNDTGKAFPTSPSLPVEPPTALNAVPASTITPPDEAKLLEFDLVRIRGPVYAWDKKKAQERTANAERVAKHREKLAAEGLRQTAVPVSLLDEVKAAGGWAEWQAQTTATAAAAAAPPANITAEVAAVGGWTAWQEKAQLTATLPPKIAQEVKAAGGWPEWEAQKSAAVAPVTPAKTVERVEVPAKLGNRDTESLSIGRRVQTLTGWKAVIMKWLLKI